MSVDHWTEGFAGLARLEALQRQHLEASSRITRLPQGSRIFGPGQSPESYLLLLSGDIRVSQTSEGGREIVLYRVSAGESCALTTACLLAGDEYQAEAVAETDIEAVIIPRIIFDEVIAGSPVFRRFVFATFSHRVTDLFRLIDETAFQRMDVRLAHKLLELAGAGETLTLTHQQLAAELGTAREVVSRQVNEFQRRGWVKSSRGSLQIENRGALRALAGG